MGSLAYTGPVEFSDHWSHALELNGITVEEADEHQETKRPDDLLIEQGYVARQGDMRLLCLGITCIRDAPSSDKPSFFCVSFLFTHSSEEIKRSIGLTHDIHRILASSGAKSTSVPRRIRTEKIFRTRKNRAALFCELSEAISHERFTFTPTGIADTTEGVLHGRICSKDERQNSQLLSSLGSTLDASTGKEYSFFAIKRPTLLIKLVAPSIRQSSRVIEQICRESLLLDPVGTNN